MRSLQVHVAAHVCGSLSTVVCSSALSISDARKEVPAADSALPVVDIGQQDGHHPGSGSGIRHMDSLDVHGRPGTSSVLVGPVFFWPVQMLGKFCKKEIAAQCCVGVSHGSPHWNGLPERTADEATLHIRAWFS